MAVFKLTGLLSVSATAAFGTLVGILGSATVTNDLILSTLAAAMPDFDKSSSDLYGRPAIIFFAVRGPDSRQLF